MPLYANIIKRDEAIGTLVVRQQPQVADVIDMLPFDREVVNPLDARQRGRGGDAERAAPAADDLARLEPARDDPRTAGLAVEAVGAGRPERLRRRGGRAAPAGRAADRLGFFLKGAFLKTAIRA
ncbi:hypothetical protein Pla123a_36710 [Posidoniimonas polymericola]|uniref:Uncharacterized protein n=1 Tax=Posidoniimonas polymericola TaxID=2528002 RepID=A0A5C5YDG2_9BACT|nr:hypothetical protein [Posidoniimonas polymericola]TWT73777.1 hypothetical protein Pla123a_36710 [Posidoniimonas polymericola]